MMENKVDFILDAQKDKHKSFMEICGIVFILNNYFFFYSLFNLVEKGMMISLSLTFLGCVFMFYFVYDTLKKQTPKFNRNIFHFCFQFICFFNVICFLFNGKINGILLPILSGFVGFIAVEIFLWKFQKTKNTELFSDEYIREWENKLK